MEERRKRIEKIRKLAKVELISILLINNKKGMPRKFIVLGEKSRG